MKVLLLHVLYTQIHKVHRSFPFGVEYYLLKIHYNNIPQFLYLSEQTHSKCMNNNFIHRH